jgi:hypothetical protein
MGLSGGGKTTTTTGPSKQALPWLNAASNTAQGVNARTQGRLDQISGSLFDSFNDFRDTAGSDLAGTRGYMGDVLGGKYLSGNPHIEGMIDQTNDNVMDRVNALFSRAGQTGSSRQIGELGKQLANAENSLRYQNYSDEMGRMGEAAQLGLGLNAAGNANAATEAALGATAAEIPWTNAERLAQIYGNLWGNSTTTTQKQSGGGLGSILGAAAQLGSAAIMASDRRLKRDVVKVGELEDGLGIYRYNYIWQKGGDPSLVGVMADEVATLRPWALGPKILGEYASVNYGAL